MAGPWEQYAAPTPAPASGPWAAYAPAAPAAAPADRLDRLATGATDVIHGGAQLLANSLPSGVVGAVNDATAWVNRQPVVGPITRAIGMTPATPEQVNQGVTDREAAYQASRTAGGAQPGDTDWWRMGGQVAASVPVALASPAAATLRGAVAGGAAQGAALSAAQPVPDQSRPYWDQVQQNATTGAMTGAAGGAVGHVVGRMLTGAQNANPNVRALNDAGVQMTPGQIVGGYTQRVEDAAGSIPVVGQQIRNAQRASTDSFNRAVANRVLQPLGQRVDPAAAVGRDLVDDVYTRIGAAYDAALPRVRPFGPDQTFMGDLRRVGGQFLTPESRTQFTGFLQNNILSRAGGGPIDGATFKIIEEELGRAFRTYRASGAPADREFADAALGVQRAFRDLLARSNPQVAPEISAANNAFARYIRMERAANAQGSAGGVFTPNQFSNAVRMSDTSARRGANARGDALLQDLGDAGRAVLPRTVPDSGTPERAMVANMLLGGGIGFAGSGGGLLPAAVGAGLGATAYSAPARSALQSLLLAPRNPAVSAAGNAIATGGPAVSVPLGALLLSPPPAPQQRR